MATEQKRMRQLADTEANWSSVNPILLDGEIGFAVDTGGMKVGPGAWNSLEYFGYVLKTGGIFTGQVALDTGAANQFEVRRDDASRIRFMSGDGTKSGMWQEYTQSAGSGRFRFYDAAGSSFFNLDMTADGDLQVTGTRWDNQNTPAVTSLLTQGRANALYQGTVIPIGAVDLDTLGLPYGSVQNYRLTAVPLANGYPGAGVGDWLTTYTYSTTAARQIGQNWNADTGAGLEAAYYRDKVSGVWGAWQAFGSSGGGGATSGATFPPAPTVGALHFKTAAPVGLYMYYEDGDSTQWVQVSDASTKTPSIGYSPDALWQNVSSKRTANVGYQNDTDNVIFVYGWQTSIDVSFDGVTYTNIATGTSGTDFGYVWVPIMPKQWYRMSKTTLVWELREQL